MYIFAWRIQFSSCEVLTIIVPADNMFVARYQADDAIDKKYAENPGVVENIKHAIHKMQPEMYLGVALIAEPAGEC